MNLVLALSYSSKWEIIQAIKRIVKEKIPTENITEETFSQYLTTKNGPRKLSPFSLMVNAQDYFISINF